MLIHAQKEEISSVLRATVQETEHLLKRSMPDEREIVNISTG